MAATVYDAYLRRNIFPAAARTIAELKSDGFDVVLVTGSIDFLVAPLARDLGATEVIANTLEEKDGRFTGSLVGAAVADEEKRARVLAYAEKRGVDLAASRAFGDSIADVPMLECVGESFAFRRRRSSEPRRRDADGTSSSGPWTKTAPRGTRVPRPRRE